MTTALFAFGYPTSIAVITRWLPVVRERRTAWFVAHEVAVAAIITGWDSAILRGTGCPALEDYYRLRSAGLLAGDSPRAARLRCALYERFFRQLLAQN